MLQLDHNILFALLDLCVPSLRRGRANLLCTASSLTDDPEGNPGVRQAGRASCRCVDGCDGRMSVDGCAVCMCARVRASRWMSVCTCVSVCLGVCMSVCLSRSLRVCVRRLCVCTSISLYPRTCARMHARMHTCVQSCC